MSNDLGSLLNKITKTVNDQFMRNPASETLPYDMASIERWAIYRALAATNDDRMEAAKLLGIGKTTLYRKLKKYEETDQEQNTAT
jgi:transcriptional regulator with PAS, ATPase and Fis domain